MKVTIKSAPTHSSISSDLSWESISSMSDPSWDLLLAEAANIENAANPKVAERRHLRVLLDNFKDFIAKLYDSLKKASKDSAVAIRKKIGMVKNRYNDLYSKLHPGQTHYAV